MLLTTTEQRPKVVRDIVLTCVVLHNMLRSHHRGADKPPTPADDIQPSLADQAEQGQNENFRNPLRKAKHQQHLLKDYFTPLPQVNCSTITNLRAEGSEKIQTQDYRLRYNHINTRIKSPISNSTNVK